MVTLIIPSYNRPAYLQQCFDSLKQLTSLPTNLIIVDDASTNLQTMSIINEMVAFFQPKINVMPFLKPVNKGIRDSLYEYIGYAFSVLGSDMVINLDSDMIVKPDFIERMVALKNMHPDKMISGINCTMRQKTGEERNPLISEHEDYYLKKYVAGQCLCYDRRLFEKYIQPALLINGNWDHNACISMDKDNLPVVVCKPSAAQHIGYESSMGHNNYGEMPDKADDFEDKLCLPDVTLFSINAHNPKGMLRAAEICQRNIQFGNVQLITDRLFPGRTLEEGRRNYSEFMIKDLHRYVATSHVLVINDDAYIQNYKAWDNSWPEWDYLGSTWAYKDNMNVGNGGFSLRSKRFCEIVALDPHISQTHPEDHMLCRVYRRYLEEKYGLKWAPEEVANRFAIEAYGSAAFAGGNVYSGQFGFHGPHVANLPISMR